MSDVKIFNKNNHQIYLDYAIDLLDKSISGIRGNLERIKENDRYCHLEKLEYLAEQLGLNINTLQDVDSFCCESKIRLIELTDELKQLIKVYNND